MNKRARKPSPYKPNPYVQAFVTIVGGQATAAGLLGVSQGLISHLVIGRNGVSPEIAMQIDRLSNGVITRAMLRPDLWGPD